MYEWTAATESSAHARGTLAYSPGWSVVIGVVGEAVVAGLPWAVHPAAAMTADTNAMRPP